MHGPVGSGSALGGERENPGTSCPGGALNNDNYKCRHDRHNAGMGGFLGEFSDKGKELTLSIIPSLPTCKAFIATPDSVHKYSMVLELRHVPIQTSVHVGEKRHTH